jgi:hypothetical protein
VSFDSPGYELKYVHKQPNNYGDAHLFTLVFKFYSDKTKYNYVLRADYHSGDVFALKFYCKKDKKSEFKYSKLVNKKDVSNILITCLKAVPILLESYPTASFGFIGSRIIDVKSKKVENYSNTQRFRTYKKLIAEKIGTETFLHVEYEQISGYLLVNRACDDLESKERALVKMFADTYNDLLEP